MKKSRIILLGLIVLLVLVYNVTKVQTPVVETPKVLGEVIKTSDCKIVSGLPDKNCTPGSIDPRVTQENIQTTICTSGYTATVRPSVSVTNKIKKERMMAYGDTDSMKNYELDHLISLELGGCPDCVSNLWPEPYNDTLGARVKDKLENYLNKQVCDSQMTLKEAQFEISSDWVRYYDQMR